MSSTFLLSPTALAIVGTTLAGPPAGSVAAVARLPMLMPASSRSAPRVEPGAASDHDSWPLAVVVSAGLELLGRGGRARLRTAGAVLGQSAPNQPSAAPPPTPPLFSPLCASATLFVDPSPLVVSAWAALTPPRRRCRGAAWPPSSPGRRGPARMSGG